MRSKIKFEGVWLRPVPWLKEGDCHGCYVDATSADCDFNTAANDRPCGDGGEFAGMIFIRNTKEGMADYVAKKLEDKT
jgi:hypothetical protein